jgi:aspartate/tyrosine/aromatic aminotransferase
VFEQIPAVPPDAILGLAALFRADDRAGKLDLTAGVYKDETGRVPKFACIAEAERRYLATEDTKVHLPIDGAPTFTAATQELVLGSIATLDTDRLRTTQTPGGTGALALVAHTLAQTVGPRRMWLSAPTWPNHPSIFQAAGHELAAYRYYRAADRSLDAEGMLDDLSRVERGDVVLLHGCCHNPTGRDLTPALWRDVAALLAERGAVALVDLAYLGLADGLAEDGAFLADVLVDGLEAFVCTSFSKNLGMYRERVGALTVVAGDGEVAEAVQSNVKKAVRVLWSNPPSLGGQAVATVLADAELRADWLVELGELRGRLNGLREALAKAIADAGLEGFAGIETERGMFTLTGLTPAQVAWLREERAIYLVGDSRANVAGLTEATIPVLVEGLREAATVSG